MVLLPKIMVAVFFVIVLQGEASGQADTVTTPFRRKGFFEVSESAHDLSKIERIGYVCGASLAYSLFDYLGWNLVRYDDKAQLPYRLLQTCVQAGLTYFLYKQCGLSSAVSFTLIWWSWGDDLGYYGWSHVLRRQPFELNNVTWAWWTPIGLTRKKIKSIDNATLVAQGMIGFWISIAIL